MSVTFVAASSYTAPAGSGGSLTTRTINVPAGVQDGDTIIVVADRAGGSSNCSISGLSGATLVADSAFTGHSSSVWIKQNASASDAEVAVTVTTTTASRVAAIVAVFRGTAVSGVLDTHQISTGVSTTTTCPAATATASDVVVHILAGTGNFANVTWTTASGFTKAAECSDTSSTGAASLQLAYNLTPIAASSSSSATAYTSSSTQNWSGWTLLLKAQVASSTVRPKTVVSNAGSWVATGAADVAACLADESDATYAGLADPGSGKTFEVSLDELASGSGNVTVVVRGQYADGAASGTLTTKLMQGSTTIATWTDTLGAAMANFTHTTSSGETATITDRTNLRLRFEATAA